MNLSRLWVCVCCWLRHYLEKNKISYIRLSEMNWLGLPAESIYSTMQHSLSRCIQFNVQTTRVMYISGIFRLILKKGVPARTPDPPATKNDIVTNHRSSCNPRVLSRVCNGLISGTRQDLFEHLASRPGKYAFFSLLGAFIPWSDLLRHYRVFMANHEERGLD